MPPSSPVNTSRWSFCLSRYWPVVLSLLLGTGLSAGVFATIRHWENQKAQAAVRTQAAQRIELLRETLGNSLETLHALGSLYQSGGTVDRERFRRFVQGALARHPELQALSYTPRVPATARAAYEAAARADGLPSFQFTERDPANGRLIPERSHPDDYFPVYFIEPLTGNSQALGFDLNARRETLDLARDRGEATATPSTRLVQERRDGPGFIVYLPLYQGAVPATVDARRRENTGFVAAVFRVADLVHTALASQPGLQVEIFDAGDHRAIYRVPAGDHAPASVRLAACDFTLPFAGREWRIQFTPTTSFFTGRNRWQAWSVLAGGLIITILLAAYLFTGLRRNAEIAYANAALQTEVTERKRAEEAAARASRAKSDFLANLSHEIRTPLNSILGYTQILERDPDLPHRHRDAIDALANSGHHLLGLLNSILDLSKIEAGQMDVQRDVFDLPTLVHGLAEMLKPHCAGRRLDLRVAAPEKGSRPVIGDEGKLRQVLINLIGNAIKFTPRGEVFVGLTEPTPGHWRFDVIDTGIGLSPEEQAGLFAPFHQTPAGRRVGGTGLGLAIARRQVELMGGALDVKSETGVGTRFYFTLPLPAAAASPAITGPLRRLAPGVRVRALVIDDNRDNRVILSRLLTDVGCAVATAGTAASTRDIVRREPPDILFLDVLLGETTGPELLGLLRRDGLAGSAIVVYHTAAVLDAAQRDALRADGADLLAKPFRGEDLCTCLRRVPGVRFDDPGADAEEAPPSVDFEGLTLPESLHTRMTVAAELHSTTVLKACIDELRQLGGPAAALADHLRLLLRSYDLAAIARLVNRLPVASPAHSDSARAA